MGRGGGSAIAGGSVQDAGAVRTGRGGRRRLGGGKALPPGDQKRGRYPVR